MFEKYFPVIDIPWDTFLKGGNLCLKMADNVNSRLFREIYTPASCTDPWKEITLNTGSAIFLFLIPSNNLLKRAVLHYCMRF